MVDQPRYSLGRAWAGRNAAPKWEDLDDAAQATLAASLARVREQMYQQIRPAIQSFAEVVTPAMQEVSDAILQLTPIAEKDGRVAEFMRRWVPNWSNGVDPDRAWDVTVEGIPLAFVPRARIVDQLIAAENRDARLDIVLSSKSLILSDCRDALDVEDDDPLPESLATLPALLREVVDVLEAGFVASACALGISVIDVALRRTSEKKINYSNVRTAVVAKKLRKAIAENDFRVIRAMRPLHSLCVNWDPRSQEPLPPMPSRGAIAHWAEPGHLSETNAILIAMAATSLLLGLAEREVVARLVEDGSRR